MKINSVDEKSDLVSYYIQHKKNDEKLDLVSYYMQHKKNEKHTCINLQNLFVIAL